MPLVSRLKYLLRRSKQATQAFSAKLGLLDDGYPDWQHYISRQRNVWQQALASAEAGQNVLISTSVGGFSAGTVLESMLGTALTLRGAKVKFLLCDRVLPGCMHSHIHRVPDPSVLARYELPKTLCDACYPRAAEVLEATELPVLRYSQLLTAENHRQAREITRDVPLEQIQRFEWQGFQVGEQAHAGTLRFYARGDLHNEQNMEPVYRRYLEASLLTTMAFDNLLKREQFDVALFNHGIYVPQGPAAEVCRQRGTRVVTWNIAYRKQRFIFSHDTTYHHTLRDEPTSAWENIPWNPQREKEVMDYLASRLTGKQDWIWFHEKPFEDIEKISRECGVDFNKPIIGMLTNVFWDAQLHYPANAFGNMLEWIVETIRYFEARPDLQLLIRVHPAEIRGTVPSRQPIMDEIRAAFPQLPANVFIIPPESNSSTYAAMYQCDAVIVYGTKTGVELSSMGIPVVVAGEAWLRGKGMSLDANSPEDYRQILDGLPSGERMSPELTQRARKYAYHFFFRRMMPLEFIQPADVRSYFTVDIQRLTDLQAGANRCLDTICQGILDGTPFIYDEADEEAKAAA